MGNRGKRSLLIVISLIALVAIVATGCGDSKTTSTSPTTSKSTSTSATATINPALETYKVGAVFAATGNNSPLGLPEKQTVEMMVEQINATGGVNGHRLEVVLYDNESDTAKCVTSVKKLIEQDGVVAIIGPTASGDSMQIISSVTNAQIPLISCAASAAIVTPIAERKWVFKTPQSDILAVNEIATYMTSQNVKKVAFLTDSAGYGQSGRGVLATAIPAAGFTVVADETFGVADTDMTPQLTKIKAAGAETIVIWGTNPGPALIAKNAQEMKLGIPMVDSHGIANKEFITVGGSAVNGVVFPAGKLLVADQLLDNDPQKALLVKYKNDFETKFGAGKANTFGGHAYDALSMVVQALKNVGPDKAKIRDYIETSITNWPGTGGVFNMSATDHNGLTKGAFVMIKIVDGKWTWLK